MSKVNRLSQLINAGLSPVCPTRQETRPLSSRHTWDQELGPFWEVRNSQRPYSPTFWPSTRPLPKIWATCSGVQGPQNGPLSSEDTLWASQGHTSLPTLPPLLTHHPPAPNSPEKAWPPGLPCRNPTGPMTATEAGRLHSGPSFTRMFPLAPAVSAGLEEACPSRKKKSSFFDSLLVFSQDAHDMQSSKTVNKLASS